jgi:hypothetical protein
MEKYPYDPMWTTRTGEQISVRNMTDTHLRNARRMMLRTVDHWERQGVSALMFTGSNSDAVGYEAEISMNHALERELRAQRWVEIFTQELRRRHPIAAWLQDLWRNP